MQSACTGESVPLGGGRFIDRTSEQQQQANAELSLMIERIEADDLRGKLSALIAPPAPDPVDEPTGVTPEVPVDAEQQPAKSGWLRRR